MSYSPAGRASAIEQRVRADLRQLLQALLRGLWVGLLILAAVGIRLACVAAPAAASYLVLPRVFLAFGGDVPAGLLSLALAALPLAVSLSYSLGWAGLLLSAAVIAGVGLGVCALPIAARAMVPGVGLVAVVWWLIQQSSPEGVSHD